MTTLPYEVGTTPHRVVLEERQRKTGRSLVLRWWDVGRGNWRTEALERLMHIAINMPRSRGGALRPAALEWGKTLAEKRALELVAGQYGAPADTSEPLTISRGWELATDADRGLYPVDDKSRREVARSLATVRGILGDRIWQTITTADLRALWRTRIRQLVDAGHVGHHGALKVVSHLQTVARWLRSEELIPTTACVVPEGWRNKLTADWRKLTEAAGDPVAMRDRHTLEEAVAIMDKARQVDPRYALVLLLGAQARLGQVVRARRSDLDLEARTLVVRGAGKKRGVHVELTDVEYRAVVRELRIGYLRDLEATGEDFPLFPAGRLRGDHTGDEVKAPEMTNGSLRGETLVHWLHEAEALAKVDHVQGRSNYGLRRVLLDAALEDGNQLDREALQEFGGWSDSQMPDRVYRSKKREKARKRARDARARIRGERTVTQ